MNQHVGDKQPAVELFSFLLNRLRHVTLFDSGVTTLLVHFQVPHSYIPYGGRRSGFYSSKVVDTLPCINELVPIALESVRSYPVCPGFVFTTADYGCADGGTSMSLIYACVEELRKLHGNELEILVYYEDQPLNDFTSLFSYVQGICFV